MKRKGLLILTAIALVGGVFFFMISERQWATFTYTGVLSVVSECAIPEGCGSKYKLFDENFQTYIPLTGMFNEQNAGRIIRVIGVKTAFTPSENTGMWYRGPREAVRVFYYYVLSSIPYHEFLVEKAGEYTMQKYPCIARIVFGKISTDYNKIFSWKMIGNTPVYKARMSGEKGSYELWYDGKSGDFIKEVKEPENAVFCP